jgi:hypothetical protein
MPGRTPSRRASLAPVLLATVLIHGAVAGIAPARATATVATAGATITGTAASWRAVATAPGAQPVPSALTLEWSSSGGVASAYLDVVNTGGLALTSQRLVVTSLTPSSTTGPDPVELAACLGATWVPDTGTCAGTVVALGSDRTSPLTTGVTLAPGARLSVRATTRPRTVAQATTTVAVVVTRADVRPPTTTSG